MKLEHLNELPLVFQIITGLGLFFGAFMLAVGGWFWKKIAPKLPEAMQPPATAPNEAVVLSAAIADSASISRLSHSIDRLIEVLTDNGEDSERGFERNYKRLGDLCDWLERTHEAIHRIERSMKDRTIL